MRTDSRTTRAMSGNRLGFTLVEVLVVIVIMSGILMTISTVLATARETRDTIHNMNETQLAGPAILDLVEADLRGLLTYSMRPSKVIRVTSRELSGEPADRIDLVTTTNSRLFELGNERALRADYNEVGYVLREREGSADFLEMYRREDFSVDEDPFEGGKYTFLHDQVRKFEILVYEEDGPDAEPLEEWNTSNEPDNRLPLRIEITLELEVSSRILDPAKHELARDQAKKLEYRRIFRIGTPAHLSFNTEPVAKIPDVPKPREQTGGDGLADPLSGGGQDPFGGGAPPGGFGGANPGNPFEGLGGSGTDIQIDVDGGTSLIDIFNQAGGTVPTGGG